MLLKWQTWLHKWQVLELLGVLCAPIRLLWVNLKLSELMKSFFFNPSVTWLKIVLNKKNNQSQVKQFLHLLAPGSHTGYQWNCVWDDNSHTQDFIFPTGLYYLCMFSAPTCEIKGKDNTEGQLYVSWVV